MTISNSIIAWLKTFGIGSISSDIQPAKATTYSLAKEPIENVKRYLSGVKEITSYYQIIARLPSVTEASRDNNIDWGERLTAWVETQNNAGNFPTLTNAVVKSVEVSTPMAIGQTQTNDSLYSLTVAIKYIKEN